MTPGLLVGSQVYVVEQGLLPCTRQKAIPYPESRGLEGLRRSIGEDSGRLANLVSQLPKIGVKEMRVLRAKTLSSRHIG